MKDLSGNDASLKTRVALGLQYLFYQGFFLFALGLGWAFASITQKAFPSTASLLVIGIGALLFVTSLLFIYRRRAADMGFSSHSAIDLHDSLRALRVHGSQVPLIERSSIRSEILSLSKRETVLLPNDHKFILEHWSGPEALVYMPGRVLDLCPQQILYFDSSELTAWEKNKKSFRIEPNDIRADEELVVVIHIFGAKNL